MSKKKQYREILAVPEVGVLRHQLGGDLGRLLSFLTWSKLVELAAAVEREAPFLRDSGTRIYPKTLHARIVLGARRDWGFN